jgi:hypothetical protein
MTYPQRSCSNPQPYPLTISSAKKAATGRNGIFLSVERFHFPSAAYTRHAFSSLARSLILAVSVSESLEGSLDATVISSFCCSAQFCQNALAIWRVHRAGEFLLAAQKFQQIDLDCLPYILIEIKDMGFATRSVRRTWVMPMSDSAVTFSLADDCGRRPMPGRKVVGSI